MQYFRILVISAVRATQFLIGAGPARADIPAPVTITFSGIRGDFCQGIGYSGDWEATGASPILEP